MSSPPRLVALDMGLTSESTSPDHYWLLSCLQLAHALQTTRDELATALEETPVVIPPGEKYRSTVALLESIVDPIAMERIRQMLNTGLLKEVS